MKKRVVNMQIGTNISILKSQLNFHVIASLKEMYTHSFEEKVIEWVDHKKRFVMCPQSITTLIERKENIFLPRGSHEKLTKFLLRSGYEVKISSELVELKLPFDTTFNLTLRDYQEEALDKILLFDEGILQAPCGSGKTVIGIAIVNELKVTTLILTHTTVIFEQWKKHLIENLGVENIGIFGGGKKEPKPITVGMIQTLYNFSPKQIQNIRSLFSCIICDEAHHIPAYTFLKIVSQFCPRFLYGLTATPNRKDQKEFLLFDFIGPIKHVITDKQLIKTKRITEVEVKWIKTNSVIYFDEWHYMVSALIRRSKRNEIIVNEIIEAATDGHFVLMLSERVVHCQMISELLNDRGIKNICICGKIKGKMQDMLDNAKQNYKIIIASMAIAKEGLDIPDISCIVLATPTNNSNTLKQMIGRGRRIKERKTLVVDLDDIAPVFSGMANNRERWYNEWGFKQSNRFDDKSVEINQNERVWGRNSN